MHYIFNLVEPNKIFLFQKKIVFILNCKKMCLNIVSNRSKHVKNGPISKYITIGQNLAKLVKTCQNWSKHVGIGQNMSELAKVCQLVKTC